MKRTKPRAFAFVCALALLVPAAASPRALEGAHDPSSFDAGVTEQGVGTSYGRPRRGPWLLIGFVVLLAGLFAADRYMRRKRP